MVRALHPGPQVAYFALLTSSGPATMPSLDIVSKVDAHELTNAVDQANRELETRFDFRGVEASFELEDERVDMTAPSEFQLDQMLEILNKRVVARGIDLDSLEPGETETNLARARRVITVHNGLDKATAKAITKQIKESKLKLTAQIQEDKVRLTGKKRDDLQAAMALLREAKFERPLQFENFRD